MENIVFGEVISGDKGKWYLNENCIDRKRSVDLPMQLGSVLVLDGESAGPAIKHALTETTGTYTPLYCYIIQYLLLGLLKRKAQLMLNYPNPSLDVLYSLMVLFPPKQ